MVPLTVPPDGKVTVGAVKEQVGGLLGLALPMYRCNSAFGAAESSQRGIGENSAVSCGGAGGGWNDVGEFVMEKLGLSTYKVRGGDFATEKEASPE